MKMLDDGLWVPENDGFFSMSFEVMVTREAMRHARQGGTFLDVGAHVGLWSMRLNDMYRRIYAVEPVSAHHACLVNNLLESNSDNVHTLNYAVGNSTQDAEMKVSVHNSGTSTLHFRNRKGVKTETVRMRKLDDIIPKPFVDINFIKMDVEGNELKALQGAREILDVSSPDIFVEVNRPEKQREYNALHYLDELGYEILYTSGCNYFLRKREHPRPKEV